LGWLFDFGRLFGMPHEKNSMLCFDRKGRRENEVDQETNEYFLSHNLLSNVYASYLDHSIRTREPR